MELRQRSQRASEPTGQNQSGPSPWSHERQTSTSTLNSQPPPPPPARTPSTPASHSSPMFTNPNFYAQHSMSARNLSSSLASASSLHSVGAATPSASQQAHRANFNQLQQRSASVSYRNPAYTAPPAVGLDRSNTEPYFQTDVLASTNAVHSPVAPDRALDYSYTAQSSVSSVNSSVSITPGIDCNFNNAAGYGDHHAAASSYFERSHSHRRRASASNVAAADTARAYGEFTNTSTSTNTNAASATGLANLNQLSASNATSNPYKAAPKATSGARLLATFAYLAILLLGGATIYLRHAVNVAALQLNAAHDDAHRRHLIKVQKTGGRHGPGSHRRTSLDSLARQNQQREILRLERANQELLTLIDAKREEHENFKRILQEEHDRLEELEHTKRDLARLIDHNQDLLDVLDMDRDSHAAMLESKDELDRLIEKRESALWKTFDRLTERVGRESYREAVDWFGLGPHKIEIELSYPQVPPEGRNDPRSWTRLSRWIVVEMASLDLMPHSVNMFLRQVHHKLWDGISLTLKNDQKIQFGPSADDDRFLRAHSNTLSYQEYNANYPHQQWTVGFAGRPAGPDFFINRIDNTEAFGLKGDKHEEADPCFGHVIEGVDILEEIGNIPHYGGGGEEDLAQLYEVKILNALIIPPKNTEMQQMEH